MQKQTGTPIDRVAPAAPADAIEADTADPGDIEEAKAAQKEAGKGKYGAAPAQPFSPEHANPADTAWIGVEILDADGRPIPGVRFQVRLADGRLAAGTTDPDGKGRIDGIPPGNHEITLPELDAAAWEPA